MLRPRPDRVDYHSLKSMRLVISKLSLASQPFPEAFLILVHIPAIGKVTADVHLVVDNA
jgi:hypothetical protein